MSEINLEIFNNIDPDINFLQQQYPDLHGPYESLHYDINTFNTKFKKSKTDLNIFHLNIGSFSTDKHRNVDEGRVATKQKLSIS